MQERAYVIRSVNTGRVIEAHDESSREWGQRKVETHNALWPLDQWSMTIEQV